MNRRRPDRNRRGGALVEAALVLPVLLLLTFGLIEFGHFVFTKHTLQGAARHGVRTAILPGSTNTEVTNVVGDFMNAAGIPTANYTVYIQDKTGAAVDVAGLPSGVREIKVRVDCSWGTVGIRPMALISSSAVVRGVAVMRKEGPES